MIDEKLMLYGEDKGRGIIMDKSKDVKEKVVKVFNAILKIYNEKNYKDKNLQLPNYKIEIIEEKEKIEEIEKMELPESLKGKKINGSVYVCNISADKIENCYKGIKNYLSMCEYIKTYSDETFDFLYNANIPYAKSVKTKIKEQTPYDSSPEIWGFREKVYELSKLSIKLKEDEKDEGNYYIEKEGERVDVSGDIIFNFTESKTKYYNQIVHEDNASEKKKECLRKIIKKCKSSYHESPMNVSIMLKTGGLNLYKQGLANDRFDVFVNEIYNFYHGQKLGILENGCAPKMSYKNRKILDDNLKLYGDGDEGFYAFIKEFYFLEKEKDKRFIDELLESGKKHIDSCDGLYEYICLAFEYWIIVADYYCKNCIEAYLKMKNRVYPKKLLRVYSKFRDEYKQVDLFDDKSSKPACEILQK